MTVTSAAGVAAHMSKCAAALQSSQKEAVLKAALTVKGAVEVTSPARLRNAGKKGGKLSTRVTTFGSDAKPLAIVKAVGPWPLIEYDTPAHLIGAGRTKASRNALLRNGVGTYLKAAGAAHPVLGPIAHPGTKGKLVFHKGVAIGTPKAAAILARSTVSAVGKVF